MIQAVLAVVSAYLLGSIPFGYLIVKLKLGQDVRETGSRSIGATNVLRTAGRAGGILTFLLDVAKGFVAVIIAKMLVPGHHWIIAFASLAAIFGHVFPLFLNFKGGKGVATGVGVFLAIFPQGVVMVLVLFVIVVVLWRYISLGSIIATSAFPFLVYFMGHSTLSSPIILATFLGAALIVTKHHENIRRLLQGTENKFTSFSKKTG